MDEAHVQHAVGLVQHEYLHARYVDQSLAGVFQQATGRGDQYVCALLEHSAVAGARYAAHDDGRFHRKILAIRFKRLIDLCSQLTRGREHKGAYDAFTALFSYLARRQPLEYRQRERCCLTRPRLRAAENVTARQRGRQCFGLYGRGTVVSDVRYRPSQCFRQSQL